MQRNKMKYIDELFKTVSLTFFKRDGSGKYSVIGNLFCQFHTFLPQQCNDFEYVKCVNIHSSSDSLGIRTQIILFKVLDANQKPTESLHVIKVN